MQLGVVPGIAAGVCDVLRSMGCCVNVVEELPRASNNAHVGFHQLSVAGLLIILKGAGNRFICVQDR